MKMWVNGRAGRAIDARDRGFNYGDGAFETMRVRRRQIRLLPYHLERLDDACRRLQMRGPPAASLRRELERAARGRADGVVKLVVSRGIGTRGYRPGGRERCSRVVSLFSAPAPAPGAVRVRVCAMRLGVNETLAGLKSLNRLESVMARTEWADPRIWEGLMRDPDDNFVCGTMSNLFVRRGSSLLTPKLDRCGVAGVMRRWVLEQAGPLRLAAREVRLRWEDLASGDEAFLTNAVAGVVPVASVQHGRLRLRFAEHATARQLAHLLERL